MVTEKSAGAVVYYKPENGPLLFLLLQPSPGKPWGFPKGKLQESESEAAAASREIFEESGLSINEFDPDFCLRIHYTYRRGRRLIKKEVTYFLAATTQMQIHLSWEHSAYCWVSLKEALEMVVYENARDTLHHAYAHLTQLSPVTYNL